MKGAPVMILEPVPMLAFSNSTIYGVVAVIFGVCCIFWLIGRR